MSPVLALFFSNEVLIYSSVSAIFVFAAVALHSTIIAAAASEFYEMS